MVTEDLGGRGNKRDQMGELGAELSYTGYINQEEKVSLSLLGKTSSVKSEFRWTEKCLEFKCILTRYHLGHC